jgi:dihydrofolate reductase
MTRVRVFIASSLDGFIAGPHDELDWLEASSEGAEDTFSPFFQQVGAMLMGRRTYDVVTGFDAWHYGDTPVLVATSRPLTAMRPSVSAVTGSIAEVVEEAKRRAGSRDVYIDGGALIRAALDAGLIDELTVTVIPMVLGRGLPLFAGVERACALSLQSQRAIGGGLVQLVYAPKR